MLLHFLQIPKSLNIDIGNAKRFLAYEIVKKLKEKNANDILDMFGVGPGSSQPGQVLGETPDVILMKLNYLINARSFLT